MRKVRHLSDEQLIEVLKKRMKSGLDKLSRLRAEWESGECIYQNVNKQQRSPAAIDARFYAIADSGVGQLTPISCRVGISMINFHAKLMMSEPTVVAQSLDSDELTRRAETYTQRYCDNIYKTTPLKTILDRKVWLDVAKKGIGVLGVEWNQFKGDIKKAPENIDDEIEMTGDHHFYYQDPTLFVIDPTATVFEVDANWCVAGNRTALSTFAWEHPEFEKDAIELSQRRKNGFKEDTEGNMEDDSPYDKPENIIVWTFYEKHMPENGMRGAKVTFLYNNGDIILISRKPLANEHGQLPFCVMTDLDTNDCYGISRAQLVSIHGDRLARLFEKVDNNIENVGETKVLVPTSQAANFNSPKGVKVIPFNASTGEKPIHLDAGVVTTDIWRYYELLSTEIDQVYASGEFDRGEINRELSSYAVLTAIERSEAKLISIFTKKKDFVSRVYTLCISDAKQYITEEREFSTAGASTHAPFKSFKGADLKGRVNLVVGFGQYQPIDPAARKEQLFKLMESSAIEKAGLPVKEVVSQLLGGDIKPIKDIADMAQDVQIEEIWRMIGREEATVQPYHEHLNHITVLAKYMNQPSFEMLEQDIKQTIFDHYNQHKTEAAKIIAQAQGPQAPQPPPGGEVAPPAPPAPPQQAPTAGEMQA